MNRVSIFEKFVAFIFKRIFVYSQTHCFIDRLDHPRLGFQSRSKVEFQFHYCQLPVLVKNRWKLKLQH